MAGSQLYPSSLVPATTGTTFWYVFVGGGSNSKNEQAMGVSASIGANCAWDLRFDVPTTLPTGTARLVLKMITLGTSGNAVVQAALGSVGDGTSLSAATLTNEASVTLTASTAGAYITNKTTIANTTLTAGQTLVCKLNFLSASWTLASVSGFKAYIVWE